jgi:NAD(P)-dependent dehydrogenase (short-subunit alcohol dehydrogenase family)
VVLGGSSGIGLAIAQAATCEDAAVVSSGRTLSRFALWDTALIFAHFWCSCPFIAVALVAVRVRSRGGQILMAAGARSAPAGTNTC